MTALQSRRPTALAHSGIGRCGSTRHARRRAGWAHEQTAPIVHPHGGLDAHEPICEDRHVLPAQGERHRRSHEHDGCPRCSVCRRGSFASRARIPQPGLEPLGPCPSAGARRGDPRCLVAQRLWWRRSGRAVDPARRSDARGHRSRPSVPRRADHPARGSIRVGPPEASGRTDASTRSGRAATSKARSSSCSGATWSRIRPRSRRRSSSASAST